MSEEYFDVVDASDQVIGRERRSEVHRRGLFHRAVHVLVFDSHGRLFLQKRSAAKDTFPRKWDSSSSGHLGCGEDYDSCAVREPQEEIGLIVTETPRRLFKVDACEETGQEHVWVYRCNSDGPLSLSVEEVETGDWFTPEQIDIWLATSPKDFAPAFPKIWAIYKEKFG